MDKTDLIKSIEKLEKEIKKRDELIYSMLYQTTNYIDFMRDLSIDINELRKRYKTKELANKEIAKNRINLL